MKRSYLIPAILLLGMAAATAQISEDFAIHIRPSADIPIGSNSAVLHGDAAYLLGGGIQLSGQYIFPSLPFLYVEANGRFGLHPSQAQTLTLTSVGGGLGSDLRVMDRLSLQVGIDTGLTFGAYESGDWALNPYAGGRAGAVWDLSSGFAVTGGAGYAYHIGYDEANNRFTDLYQGVNAWIGGVIRFNPDSGRQKLKTEGISTTPIFPVFYSYYEQNPFGTVTIKNTEKGSIQNVEVFFDINEYMEQPMLCQTIEKLVRNESAQVDLKALFNGNILNLTESTKISGQVIVEYSYLGKRFTTTIPHTVRVLDRNSMTWDDDRKAASFVTPRDPTVLVFSKNTAGLIRDMGQNPLNLNFRIAMGVFEALRLYGMNYVIDPQSSYVEASQDELFLDYLQFPSQSLIYRAGDCDDLSILFAALLESVSIETAFVTVPGHIFMAFSLGLSEEEAKREFANTADFIFIDGRAWAPVEITLIQDGFIKAYKTGAKQWRDASEQEVAGFYAIHDAWDTFEPVGFSGSSLSLLFPSPENIIERYSSALNAFVSEQIEERVDYYKDRLRQKGESVSTYNSFGILYARYGIFDQAEEMFVKANRLNSKDPKPMFNLGNIYFLQKEYVKALSWYKKAESAVPDNPLVLAGLARTQFELEEYEAARNAYAKLALLSPDIAANYAYLSSTKSSIVVRAASAQDKGKTFFSDSLEAEETE
ncbi:MAG: tetratricopeptide repeat protein [Spirochaetales bacterium]|nr:tetratricopeptide repeat protein [Spirochaetales bacterium]